ncbi:hypothetical protein DDB_G0271940 [Dictyostelium discoideum AX4]|uniref:Uncharacterized protein n=1 Tax=Dictyostelium discoideum TaxID=44689 RepID=Q55AE1_DICDI|nr:hypothetical protein DDB_G0271940 [Dictyostelium discoideum AX4]EAL71494.1 hypothetical protein DDB_G0271940 [Dictyostelium discoideum AX4]|eukprot:XP_645415.1 hypothetical protein DDB_G0271940 [Dictyostelium discoideum AX4]
MKMKMVKNKKKKKKVTFCVQTNICCDIKNSQKLVYLVCLLPEFYILFF